MKREFNSCAYAMRWIMQNTKDEFDFKSFREQLDINHLFTGKFFLYTNEATQNEHLQIVEL